MIAKEGGIEPTHQRLDDQLSKVNVRLHQNLTPNDATLQAEQGSKKHVFKIKWKAAAGYRAADNNATNLRKR